VKLALRFLEAWGEDFTRGDLEGYLGYLQSLGQIKYEHHFPIFVDDFLKRNGLVLTPLGCLNMVQQPDTWPRKKQGDMP
jgi:hypothetical protein